MYFCVFWCEIIDLVGFLADIVWDQSLSETQIFENKLRFSTK